MTDRKQILNLALPAMAENILQMAMGLVDSYLVAQLGLWAVSGVAIATNILAIYQALFIALGGAAASLLARNLAQKNEARVRVLVGDALCLTLVLSLGLGFLAIWMGPIFFQILGADGEVAVSGASYLAIVGGGSLFLGLMILFGNVLRAQGRPVYAMQVSLLSNLLNAVLSALAISVWGWGLLGVAAATVFSRFFGTLLLWRALDLNWSRVEWRLTLNRELTGLALPAAGERLMMRLGDLVLMGLLVHLGTEVVAGNAIGESLTQFNYMPGLGFATATVILVARHLGLGDREAMNRVAGQAFWLALGCMILVGLLIYSFGGPLIDSYTDDSGASRASQLVLLYSLLGTPATAATLVYTAVWQGLGRAELPFYATSIGMWGIRISLAYLLGVVFKLGLSGVWIGTISDNLFRGFFLYYRYKQTLKS